MCKMKQQRYFKFLKWGKSTSFKKTFFCEFFCCITLLFSSLYAQKTEIKFPPPQIVLLDTCAKPQVTVLKKNQLPKKSISEYVKKNIPFNSIGNLTNYSTEQGLALSGISCGFQDKKGNLWFGTYGGGISCYDGNSFTNYSINNGLQNNVIRFIEEDDWGNLWFAGEMGVDVYNGTAFSSFEYSKKKNITCIRKDKKGTFWLVFGNKVYYFTPSKDGKSSGIHLKEFVIPSNFLFLKISGLFIDSKGIIWFGTENQGLLAYGGPTTETDSTKFEFYTAEADFLNGHILSIIEDNYHNIWFASHKGLFRFNGKTFKKFTTKQGLPDNTVLTAIKDKKGNLWIGTNNGVSFLSKNLTNTDTPTFKDIAITQDGGTNIVLSITEDTNENLWFGTYGAGVIKYNGDNTNAYSSDKRLLNNNVRSIAEDKDGALWLGSNSGDISYFDGKLFSTFKLNPKFPANIVLAITKDRANNLWFGTFELGAVKFDQKKFTFYSKSNGLNSNAVRCITEDKQGNLWFGTFGGGVSCYNPNVKDGLITNYTTKQGLANNNLRNILEDKNGVLWLGTENGISRFDGKSFTNYTTANGLIDNYIKSMVEDKFGNIWVGTANGISCLNINTSSNLEVRFTNFTSEQGLADNTTYALQIAPAPRTNGKQNALYIGTNQGYSVLTGFKTPNGKLLSFENPELNVANPDFINYTPIWEYYNVKNGYPIKDLNTNAMCLAKIGFLSADGKSREGANVIWGGCGDDKVVRFDPAAIHYNSKAPLVILKSLKINEEKVVWHNLAQNKVKPSTEDSLAILNEELLTFDKPLSEETRTSMKKKFANITFSGIAKWHPIPETLTLPYKFNKITFDFVAIETDKNFLVRYQYILDGNDSEWSPITDKTAVTYGNLHEGTYTFKLKACSPNGIWSEPISYTFKVLPPWWRTWWMYLIYVIALIAAITRFIKWREQNFKNEKLLLEKKVEDATQQIREEKEKIEHANELISEQKKEVEEKNKDILDSIHYAKRIQDALLKAEEHVSMHLPEHFILFLPKDIVSGDFYWATEKNEYWYIAAVDCTGHGVPGAFMSMLGMSFLNDIVSEPNPFTPAEILNQLRVKVINELRQTGESGGNKDGMDISLVRIDLKTKAIQWAGANNAINIIQNGNLLEVKANKQPIGYHPEQIPFTNHSISVQPGDSIYIYTDGYADQFGGPKGKKFKYKQLEDLLLANSHLPMVQQKELLKTSFLSWKANLEQVDDVCVIGIKIQ